MLFSAVVFPGAVLGLCWCGHVVVVVFAFVLGFAVWYSLSRRVGVFPKKHFVGIDTRVVSPSEELSLDTPTHDQHKQHKTPGVLPEELNGQHRMMDQPQGKRWGTTRNNIPQPFFSHPLVVGGM